MTKASAQILYIVTLSANFVESFLCPKAKKLMILLAVTGNLATFAALNQETLPMPKIFEYFGFIFFFYSNEHEPIHVHVTHQGCQSVFELIMMDGELSEVRVRDKVGEEPLSAKDKKTAEAFIRKYNKNIIAKWVRFFVMKQVVKSTNIKKKL